MGRTECSREGEGRHEQVPATQLRRAEPAAGGPQRRRAPWQGAYART
jgi:hypothetical protein